MKNTILLLSLLALSCYATAQPWLDHLSLNDKKAHLSDFKLEQVAFEAYWLNSGKAKYDKGEHIEGLKHYFRRKTRFKRDQEKPLSNSVLHDNIEQFRVLNSNSDTCMVSVQSYEYEHPLIVENLGSGVVRTIYFHEPDQSIWTGGYPGGLLMSPDMGSTWIDKGQNLPLFNIESIAVNPFDNNHIVVNNYQTKDGGLTWNEIVPITEIWAYKSFDIIFFPNTPGKCIFSADPIGTFISYDNLNTYTQLNSDFCSDFKFLPGSNAILYCLFAYSGSVGKSIDGGLTWNTSQSPQDNITHFDVTASNPNVVYGININSNPSRLYKSSDQGANWTLVNGFQIEPSSTFWVSAFAVSSTNENFIFTGTVGSFASLDGGVSFYRQSPNHYFCQEDAGMQDAYLHLDIQCATAIPNSDLILIGTDGGIYTHDFNSNSYLYAQATSLCPHDTLMIGEYIDITSGMTIGEVFGFDYESDNEGQFVTALWHNGTALVENQIAYTTLDADGFNCYSNPTDNNEYYCSRQTGNILRMTKDPATSVEISAAGSGSFQTHFRLDPVDPNILYHIGAAGGMKRSVDKGNSWVLINTIFEPLDFDIHPADNNHIYTIENSSIHYSNNKGSSWQVSNLSGNGIGVIGKIRADRNTTDDVFICTDQEVFSVQDHGASISNITYNLPQITIQAFEIDENNNLYVATTSAVYFLQDGGQYWHELGSDLPFIPVNILRIDNGREKLYVCTDGRGVWSIDLPECSKTDNVNNCSFSLSPNPAVNQFTVKDFKNSSNVITKIENIRIYNMSNDLVYQKNISDYSYTFKNIPFLSRNQYYIIELIDENGQGCTKQFLKN